MLRVNEYSKSHGLAVYEMKEKKFKFEQFRRFYMRYLPSNRKTLVRQCLTNLGNQENCLVSLGNDL